MKQISRMGKASSLTIIALVFCLNALVFVERSNGVQWDYTNVAYGTDSRQTMNIALPQTDVPHGIFFWAHANGGSPFSMAQDSANAMLENGYAVISWGSVSQLQTENDVEVGWADAQAVFDYVRSNAATWNLDADNVIIGGRSRGSIVSWMLAHSSHPAIKGIYMYNALPESVWGKGEDTWVEPISVEAPETYLVFGPSWGHPDGHRPDNVIPIQNRYRDLGISERFTLYQDMWGDFTNSDGQWINEYRESHYFPELLAKLDSDCESGFDIGDTNHDGNVNLLDVAPFVAALADGSFLCEADTNKDGEVDLLDIDSFVDLLAGG